MSGRIFNVSPSLLAGVRQCATYGLTRHVLGYTSAGDAIKAKAGSAYHAGMAVYLDPAHNDMTAVDKRTKALASLHAVYDDAWKACPPEKLDQAYTPENLHRLFDRWMELHPPSAMPWARVLEVETAFVSRAWFVTQETEPKLYEITGDIDHGIQLALARGDDAVRLILRPDALVETADNIVGYVDTKTTGWNVNDASWSRDLRMSLQTILYADGVVQRFPDRAHYRGWINACEIKKLPESDRKCTTHKGMTYAECGPEHCKTVLLDCHTNAETVKMAVLEAKRAATQFVKLSRLAEQYPMADNIPIGDVPIEGRSKGGCRWCPNAEWCETGSPMQALGHFLIHDPWVVDIGTRVHPA